MKPLPFKLLVKDNFPLLSTGQKKVANYLIENLDESAFKTAYQIGKKAGVSETTVIRLSFALGFEGFSNMQTTIQNQLLQQHQTELLENHQQDEKNDPFKRVIESEVHILRHLLNPTNINEIWKAVDALIKADQVLIVGYSLSHAAAYWFSHMLSTLRENVSLCSPNENFVEKFCNLTKNSVVVAFSFPRYSNETIKIAEFAAKHEFQTIAVTDRLLSPIGQISDIVLTTEEKAETGVNSISSVISLLDLIIEGIHQKDQNRVHAHQQKLEMLYSSFHVFNE
ncbi:RpiR-family transcriptional regulator [Bacillus sp. MUM 116]|uniref:MurR/RpiR family transcriptional regulator n=1 Tax=Bacillus sp. MUM 116 TaxID=1678002 RepID=UPI0008F58D2A|nr:MurR/RpiR family transcriptional regulator [Bacillus sp. MUM 116]OIK09715.1 RpiR-family transcriptional regulator [Bacillus sp. MUM 116]